MKKKERHEKDFYITPDAAIDVLLNNYELKPGWILEPCAGNGAIVKAIHERSNWDGGIYAVEIRPEEYDNLVKVGCEEVLIKDFLEFKLSDLKYAPPCPPRTIITNPPFSIAQKIIEKSFDISTYPDTDIIMFLRLGFLESKNRAEFWLSHKDVSLITLKKRPSFTGRGTDFAAYAWFIWNGEQQFVIPCA
ncbi:hypothetical protein Psfp_02328 [Pelotomaculum sp. FP]|uniref:hypothetical protein n=1 Tax=Pelotomaculum sp. FP TaxID=261474 RepID=UPI0010668F3B|nr:hypothetical protein [Pelotomaculum sp. FP]TEB15152.1 hypothetical protein Psfp_02328 [Pelotomaculum sp. FP]